MRLVGGNLALDLVNSRTGPPGVPWADDALAAYPELLAWGVYAGALSEAESRRLLSDARADPAGAGTAFQRALVLRDNLDEVFRAIAHGEEPGDDSLARLRDDEVDALGHARLVLDGALSWTWTGDRTFLRPVRPAVHAAVQLLAAGAFERLRQCGGCPFLFHDETKNNGRRWCSMQDCGKAEKMRRYVEARRARATGTAGPG